MPALSGRARHAARPIGLGDSPAYADDYDAPDPADGSYHPRSWSADRMALATDEHRTDRQTHTTADVLDALGLTTDQARTLSPSELAVRLADAHEHRTGRNHP